MRAYLNLRYTLPRRCEAFTRGLRRLGYTVVNGMAPPESGDVFVTWNRVRQADKVANMFQAAGNPVIVAENATWGNEFAGQSWYTLARNYHNTAGCFPIGDSARWDSLGVELQPFRTEGETVLLPQRGIGSPPTRMPNDWIRRAIKNNAGRVRAHPGRGTGVPLEVDLRKCGKVVTWGSGAAVKALMMGIPAESHMPSWIAYQDNTDEGRLAMLQKLAWAQWRLDEISSGEAFDWLLNS